MAVGISGPHSLFGTRGAGELCYRLGTLKGPKDGSAGKILLFLYKLIISCIYHSISCLCNDVN